MSAKGSKEHERDIGFTFVEDGEKTLPTGQKVPKFTVTPNNIDAHRKAIAWIEEDAEEGATA